MKENNKTMNIAQQNGGMYKNRTTPKGITKID